MADFYDDAVRNRHILEDYQRREEQKLKDAEDRYQRTQWKSDNSGGDGTFWGVIIIVIAVAWLADKSGLSDGLVDWWNERQVKQQSIAPVLPALIPLPPPPPLQCPRCKGLFKNPHLPNGTEMECAICNHKFELFNVKPPKKNTLRSRKKPQIDRGKTSQVWMPRPPVECPNCSNSFENPGLPNGGKVQCSKCNHKFELDRFR